MSDWDYPQSQLFIILILKKKKKKKKRKALHYFNLEK